MKQFKSHKPILLTTIYHVLGLNHIIGNLLKYIYYCLSHSKTITTITDKKSTANITKLSISSNETNFLMSIE